MRAALFACAALAVAVMAGAATAQQAQLTPDQLFVRDVREAIRVERVVLGRLQPPVTAPLLRSAAIGLGKAIDDLDSALDREAVGVRGRLVGFDLIGAKEADQQAIRESKKASPNDRLIRAKVKKALGLKLSALRLFGTPLKDEFEIEAELREVQPPFEKDSGMVVETPKEAIGSIILGAPDRATANAVEQVMFAARRQAAGAARAGALPITRVLNWAIANTTTQTLRTGKCSVAKGIVSCPISPAMGPGDQFNLVFGPKLKKGTKVLVKFRTPGGRRAYEILTMP